MDSAILISALALGLSAVTFFYKLGRDTNKKEDKDMDNEMLSQIYRSTETINKKLDGIAEWQRKAAEIHATHEERIKTLFSNLEQVSERLNFMEKRLDDREVLNKSLQKILERLP